MNKDEKIALCTLEKDMTADQLADKYGTPTSWGEHPVFDRKDWRYVVENGDTNQGYWDWVCSEIEGFFMDLDDEDGDDVNAE